MVYNNLEETICKLWELQTLRCYEEGILRSIISSQTLQHAELATSFKVKFSPTHTKMALVARGTKEEEQFFYCLAQNLSFWQTFLLLLWSLFACCHKGCNFFQTLIGGLLKESLKQIDFEAPILETKDLVFFFPKPKNLSSPSQTLKIVFYTPNPKPSKQPIAMKSPNNTQNIYCLL